MMWLQALFKMLVLIVILTVYGGVLGKRCHSMKDCDSMKARCITGKCICLSTQVFTNGRCLPKISPGQSPCSEDLQCTSMWPNTRCVNTICQCTKGVHVMTRDGIVCIDSESCPLGGKDAVLRDANGNKAECYIGPSGYMSGCFDQLHMYDCIRDKNNGTHFFCCPSKANTCSQPKDEGRMPKQLTETKVSSAPRRRLPWYLQTRALESPLVNNRWYFDHLSGTCHQFNYKGSRGSSNNFKTKEHCENYCKTTCGHGSPMFQKSFDGKVHQFLQRQQMCNPKTGCEDGQFSCDILLPGKALCCPNKDFICSDLGGLPQRILGVSYDEGIFCGSDKILTTRWHYNQDHKKCEPFQYKGCSGNYNNFDSLEACQKVCLRERSRLH